MQNQLSMNLDPFHETKKIKEKHVCSPLYSFMIEENEIVLEKTCQICGVYAKVIVKTGFGLLGSKSISEFFKEETEIEQNENLPFKKRLK